MQRERWFPSQTSEDCSGGIPRGVWEKHTASAPVYVPTLKPGGLKIAHTHTQVNQYYLAYLQTYHQKPKKAKLVPFLLLQFTLLSRNNKSIFKSNLMQKKH